MKQPVAKLECLACGYTDYRMSNKPEGELILEECPRCQGDMVVKERDELPEKFERIGNFVNDYFHVWDFVISSDEMEFLVETENLKENFRKFLDDIEEEDYIAKIDETDGELRLQIQEAPEVGESNVMINVALFLATIVTTFGVAGYWFLYHGNVLKAGLFSFSLLTILGSHELAHKFSAWKYGVKASWPYFIPLPHPYIGTLGAVIKNKTPIPSKEGLVGIGASGPICGFIFAIPITLIGLNFSQAGGDIFQMIPTPLIFSIFGKYVFGYEITGIDPHPLAWAGFLGLLVTWLNLLPTGQLDGGHVARSLLSQENHFILTRSIGFLLIFLGWLWGGFLILGIFILFIIGSPHPGALDNISELADRQKIIVAITILIFIVTIPIPMWMV